MYKASHVALVVRNLPANSGVRMAITKKSTTNRSWRGRGEKGALRPCWWECKLEPPPWRQHGGPLFWAVPGSVTRPCLALCDPMDCSAPGSSVQRDSPAKNTRVGCHASFRGSSQPRDQTRVSHTELP